MLTFDRFDGINNVQPSARITAQELVEAVNVDAGLSGELRRRQGTTRIDTSPHSNLHKADGYLLATVDGDLTAITDDDRRILLRAGMGSSRVWYCDLPDGRVAFSNGSVNGITDGVSVTGWGVPAPTDTGAAIVVEGAAALGEYRYALTYVRLVDGLEGGPIYSAPLQVDQGGLVLTSLPVTDGYKINIYLTSHNDGTFYLSGSTTSGAYSFTGANDTLVLPMRSDFEPAPMGTICATWRGRALIAVNNVLYASLPHNPEAFNVRRDFKQFTAPITLIQPVDSGVFVGTKTELAFLRGEQFDTLIYSQMIAGQVVLGSGVEVPGDRISDGLPGKGMVCIADRLLVAGLPDGRAVRLTDGRYQIEASEVAATFKMTDGIPQYLAIPL